MQPSVSVSLDAISRSETGCCLNMTVSKGDEREQLVEAVSEETAAAIEIILQEQPFRPTKRGSYRCEVQEISEGSGFPKTLTIQISKGRARTKREVVVDKALFLTLWNILHFQEMPTRMPTQKRLY